jgi:lysyl-tRNA synthetase class I
MGISKNNPAARDNTKLVIYCEKCDKPVKPTKVISSTGKGKMVYKCSDEKCGFVVDIYKGSYKALRHEWIKK